MNLVCLDSHYFMWAILRTASPNRENMIPRAEALFRRLDETSSTILVPTPIITELLMEVEASERVTILNAIEARCHVVEYDTMAAKNAADVWNAKKRSGVIEEIRRTGVSMRTKIKIDTQIIGVAMAHGVNILYTEDEGLRAMADGFLVSSPIPEFQQQTEFNL